MTKQPEQLPARATAEQGEVLVDGPNGYVVSLTPEAATGTARALRAAARKAQRQRDEAAPSAPREHEGGGADKA
jgi:hypothetical protein